MCLKAVPQKNAFEPILFTNCTPAFLKSLYNFVNFNLQITHSCTPLPYTNYLFVTLRRKIVKLYSEFIFLVA